jgi:alpha-galactosidase
MPRPVHPVSYDADRRLWLLSTPNSAYALRQDPDGSPRHVGWGAPSAVAAAPDKRASPAASSFESDATPDEIGIETGARFGPAGLQVRFADGTRGVQWRADGHEIDGGHLTIRLRDRRYPLSAELHYQVRADTDVIERWLVLANTGDTEQIIVGRCDSASWTLPARADYRVSHLVGGWNSEFQLRRGPLPVAETVFTSRRGITSHHANPWLALDDGTADEERGEVWSTAVAWSGSWRVSVHRDPVGRVTWTGGFGHEGPTWTLAPGGSLRTPVFAGLYTAGGFGGASRGWHRYLRDHVLPNPAELRPVVCDSWEATGFAVDEAGQKKLARIAADLGVELFVMDDGWFGARRDDTAGLGDWTPYPAAFPDGLGPLIAEVNRLGMRFGLWVEPEMVNPDSDLYRAHPDWVMHAPTREHTTLRHQLVLDFGRPEVAAWAHDWLDRLLRDHPIDFLKWDANRAVTEAGQPGGPDPDRLWTAHTRGVYEVMDLLRADHPRLRIEACAGGGGRADTGILARTDQVWVSDNTDPVDRIAIQHGFGQVYPARTMSAWVTDSPNVTTGRITPLRFRFHVAMAGALGIGGDLTSWPERDLDEARELIAVYKRIRPIVQNGELHRLTAPDGVTAVHYADPDRDEHVVLAWLVTTRFGHGPAALRLRAVRSDATYHDLDRNTSYRGSALIDHGIPLELPPGDYASTLIRLRGV